MSSSLPLARSTFTGCSKGDLPKTCCTRRLLPCLTVRFRWWPICPRRSNDPGDAGMILYWLLILALSMLLYVLLDGFDLGVGMLFGMTRDDTRRRHMLAAVSPLWDGNETWL